jgi:transcriptional regulator with XRE-family HTH domain
VPRPHGASARRRARTAARQIQALQLRLDGFSTVEVAARLTISQPSAWALFRGGLNRWLAQADGLAEELINIEYARLEQERVKAIENEETLLAHLAELKAQPSPAPQSV